MRLALFICLLVPTLGADWSPRQFGARGDGVALDTGALQHAIDAAHHAGGGIVALDAGRYLTGSLELRSGVTLQLARDAVLLGSPRIADYRRGAKWPALLIAVNAEHIALTGEGVVDGQGTLVAADTVRIFESGNLVEFFPGLAPGETVNLGADTRAGRVIDPHALQRAGTLASIVAPRSRADLASWRVDECVRPQLIEFSHCRGVRVSGVTLRHAANWVQSYRRCEDLALTGVRVDSTTYWNNDGMDIVNCHRVRIADCDINAADDAICLKSEPNTDAAGCEDIVIERCRLRSSASALKFGTASHHAFRRIRADGLEIRDTYRSAVAIESVDGAVIEDIEIANVRAINTGNAFFLRLGQRQAEQPPGVLRRVVLRNFAVEIPAGAPDAGYEHAGRPLKFPANVMPAVIAGLPDGAVTDITLRDIRITYAGGADPARAARPWTQLADIPEARADYPEFTMFGELPAWGLFVRHAQGLRLENISFRTTAPDFRPALVADRVDGFFADRLAVAGTSGEPVVVLAGVTAGQLGAVTWPDGRGERVRRLPAPAR